VDQANAAEFPTVASFGMRYCFLHQLHSYWLSRIQSHSFLIYGEIEIDIHMNYYCKVINVLTILCIGKHPESV